MGLYRLPVCDCLGLLLATEGTDCVWRPLLCCHMGFQVRSHVNIFQSASLVAAASRAPRLNLTSHKRQYHLHSTHATHQHQHQHQKGPTIRSESTHKHHRPCYHRNTPHSNLSLKPTPNSTPYANATPPSENTFHRLHLNGIAKLRLRPCHRN